MAWFGFQMNPQFLLDIFTRIFAACLLGGVIGFEREYSRNRPAGFRTHILVCMGSCLTMVIVHFLITAYEGKIDIDPTRMAGQVVSGIGFLGAGAILRHGASVKGITTAASIWVVAGVGLACGVGFYTGAVLATVLVWAVLMYLKGLENKLTRKKKPRILEVEGEAGKQLIIPLNDLLKDLRISVRSMEVTENPETGRQKIFFNLEFENKALDLAEISAKIYEIDGILKVSL
ncbi:MAG TPA: MgtC/SapB family protein [Clostridiaceae bacterium]|nr:MgtC/SapB family protein [Clostridiaceae bacterium]